MYASRLRAILGSERLVSGRDGYRLRLESHELDVLRFEQGVARGHELLAAGDNAGAQHALREALEAWRGPLLDELDVDIVPLERRRLEELRQSAAAARIDAELGLGGSPGLLAEIEALVARYPTNESLVERQMLALYREGRQEEALAAFRSARRHLGEALGIEPGPGLREMQRRILDQDPSLGVAPVSAVGNLPSPASSFVGRRSELEALVALAEGPGVRLLTLVGPPGMGKTRLSIALAERLARGFADGAWFADLGSVADPQRLELEIAATLGVTGRDVAEAIGDRRLLLVLDNLEHLLDGIDIVATLLSRCRNLVVLATSRERLRLTGEHLFDTPPLGIEDAVTLFSARARALRPEVELDGSAERICLHLDCMPLAIELAAGRVDELEPEALLVGLGGPLATLVDGVRDAPDRQRTLRAAIAWSFERLPSLEQRVLAALSVFAGGCTVEAAGAVADADTTILRSLADRHLLELDGSRVRLLQSIREYAGEALARHDGVRRARERHVTLFRSLAAGAFADLLELDDHDRLTALQVERDNLTAALGYARAAGDDLAHLELAATLGPFWLFFGPIEEGRRELGHAVEAAGLSEDLPAYGDAVEYAAALALSQGEIETAAPLAARAVSLARAAADDLRTARALNTAGGVALFSGAPTARSLLEESAALATRAGNSVLAQWAQANLAYLALFEGRYEDARHALLAVEPERPSRRLARGTRAINLGLLELELGRPEEAERWSSEARHQVDPTAVSLTADLLVLEAAIAAHGGDRIRCARLLGCSSRTTGATGHEHDPLTRRHAERAAAIAVQELGREAFAFAHAEGERAEPHDVLEPIDGVGS